jgi:hypothetical protein
MQRDHDPRDRQQPERPDRRDDSLDKGRDDKPSDFNDGSRKSGDNEVLVNPDKWPQPWDKKED